MCFSCDGSEKKEGRWGEGGIGEFRVACMCAGDVLLSCDVSDKWRVEGIVRWTEGRVGVCACEVHHALDGGFGRCVPMSCRRYEQTQLFGKMFFLRSVDLHAS